VGDEWEHKNSLGISVIVLAAGMSKRMGTAKQLPAGLNIGAESPEEIALSIMAEIVAVRHKAQ
jgi:xanthine/CO dehydrogenase XdhC/CoxF family maturation factor